MIKLKSIDGTKEVEGRRIFNSDGSPTAYIVTEDGQIYSDELEAYRRLDKPNKLTNYITVSLSIDGVWKKYTVHKLVADAFLSNEHNYPCVNHKDCDHTNNHYNNLEHCTYSYNSRYAVIYGNAHYTKQEQRSKLPEDVLREMCMMIQNGYRNKEIAKTFGVNKSYVENLRGRACHTNISKDYDFGDDFKHYSELGLKGNEGNHYIPPLEVEPKYIKPNDPENIEKICEMISKPEYISSRVVSGRFKVSEKFIKAIRNGEIFREISSKYNINNDKSTVKKVYYEESDVEKIFEKLSSGDYTIHSLSVELNIAPDTIKSMLNDSSYKFLRTRYNLDNIKKSKKGHPLTKEKINEVVDAIRHTGYTREKIAKLCDVSLDTVCKIKRRMKNGEL